MIEQTDIKPSHKLAIGYIYDGTLELKGLHPCLYTVSDDLLAVIIPTPQYSNLVRLLAVTTRKQEWMVEIERPKVLWDSGNI